MINYFTKSFVFQTRLFLKKFIYIPGLPGRTLARAARTRSRPPRPGSARPRRTGGRTGGTSPGRPGTESPLGRSRAWRLRGDSWWSCLCKNKDDSVGMYVGGFVKLRELLIKTHKNEILQIFSKSFSLKMCNEPPCTVSRSKAKASYTQGNKRATILILGCK